MNFPNQPTPGPARPAAPPPVLGYSAPATAQGAIDHTVIKKFRDQSLALGVLWILLGCLAGGLVWFVTRGGSGGGGGMGAPLGGAGGLVLGITGALALLWIALGVLTCLKQIWAVYVGLVLSYISVVANLVQLNVCALIILAFVILQAHRVIGWAGKLRAAGVPLTAKP